MVCRKVNNRERENKNQRKAKQEFKEAFVKRIDHRNKLFPVEGGARARSN